MAEKPSKIPIPILKSTTRYPLRTFHDGSTNVQTGAIRKKKTVRFSLEEPRSKRVEINSTITMHPPSGSHLKFNIYNDPKNVKQIKYDDRGKTVSRRASCSGINSKHNSSERPPEDGLAGIDNFTNNNWTELMEFYVSREEAVQNMDAIGQHARACIIHWLIRFNIYAPGGESIVALAASYFDRVMTKEINSMGYVSPMPRLSAAACYSLACRRLNLYINDKSLVESADNAFTLEELKYKKTEVLKEIDTKETPITPLAFINYFSKICDVNDSEKLKKVATLMYIAGLIHNLELSSYFPSVIAISAVKNALCLCDNMELLTKLNDNKLFGLVKNKTNDWESPAWMLWQAFRCVAKKQYEYRAIFNIVPKPIWLSKMLIDVNRNHYNMKFATLCSKSNDI